MSFKMFKFHPTLNAGIAACGYTVPTPILAARDNLGLAQTGTGKTAAFVLPLLQRLLEGPRKRVRDLIMGPTRELAKQIHNHIGRMTQKPTQQGSSFYLGTTVHP